ncbi:hypothetical protein U2J09_22630 [Serratia liquefaciens]|uniref:hypothetical protein n=1 Tax=Serratia liquefaciens TaxID=614 RepID=UPI0032DFB8E9
MYRVIFFVLILSVIAVCLFLFPIDKIAGDSFRCSTHLSADVAKKNGDRIEFNININVVEFHKENSEVIVTGTLLDKDKSYSIYRRIFVPQKPSPLKDYSAAVITCEKRHPKDNVPDILWQNYVLPEVPGVMFYMEKTHLRKNALFYKGLDKPIFICTISE